MMRLKLSYILAFGALLSALTIVSLVLGLRAAEQRSGLFQTYYRIKTTFYPDPNWKQFRENSYRQLTWYHDKVLVPRPSPSTSSTLVLFIIGQSNAANWGGERYVAKTDVILNYYNGNYYRAADPLLGAHGTAGSPWVLLANNLITKKLATNIVLVSAAVGGSSVRDWATGGYLNGMLISRLQDLRRHGLVPTHVLWHQGETDHPENHKATLHQYELALTDVIATVRQSAPQAKIYIARASRCKTNLPSPRLTDVQTHVALTNNVSLGPDTDLIPSYDRYDECHLSGRGLERHASAWLQILVSTTSP